MGEKMVIEVSKNRMFAVITFFKVEEETKDIDKDYIANELRKNSIVYGVVDDTVLEEIAANKKYNFKYLIARGLEPVQGKNGTLIYKFDTEKRSIKPKVMEDGNIDFKNLDLIEMTHEGDVLVSRTLAVKGKPGMDIYGKVVEEYKPKEAVLPKGKNVKISEDGLDLISEMDGQISFIEGRVSVFSSYEVPANVDNSTGNVNFIGNVVVKGNVLTGFSIKAGGSVEVYGVVEGAEIEAGGDIILYRGMQGMAKGKLKAGGSVTAKYIENSIIEAKGDVTSSAIMHSTVKAGGAISSDGKRGLIVGGSLQAKNFISAKTIGSPMATITDIEVGVAPELAERLKELKDETLKYKSDIVKTSQMLEMLIKLKEVNKLTPEKEQLLEKTILAKKNIQDKLNEYSEEMNTIENDISEMKNGFVKAYNVVYPGVKIKIGNVFTNVREEKKFCKIVSEFAEIRFHSYS